VNEIKPKKKFTKKWWFWAIIGLFVIGILSNLNGNKNENINDETQIESPDDVAQEKTDVEDSEPIAEEPEPIAEKPDTISKTYKNGKFLVGKDIEAGLYKVKLTDTIMKIGYIERSKDLEMSIDSILANIILQGDGYLEILDTDVAVKLQGVEIERIELENLIPNIKNEATDGMYLIGYDLAPGTYKVEVTDTTTEMGYVERSSSAAMDMNDIIANEIVQGQSYIEIIESDFLVRLQGVKITKQQ
jgi:hypothetical protein